MIPKTNKKLANHEPLTIVTWGDSVTAGGDASTPDNMFARLFPARLQMLHPNSKITAINAGIGATNTDHRLPNLEKEVLSHHPDLVTIEFVNDMPFDEAHLRRNYAQIIEKIHTSGAEIILTTPHFTMPEMMAKQLPRGGETRPAVEVLRKIAAENKIALADVSKRWEHLDAEGIPYGGPDQGIEESLYFRDPDGIQIELLSDELMYFGGQWLDGR